MSYKPFKMKGASLYRTTTSPLEQKKGKIIYKDGKKFYQAADGTLHTGQVSDVEREKEVDKNNPQPPADRPEPTYEGTDEYRKEEDISKEEFKKRGVKKTLAPKGK